MSIRNNFIFLLIICAAFFIQTEGLTQVFDEDYVKLETLEKKMSEVKEDTVEIVIKEKLQAEIPKIALPEGKIFIKEIITTGATILSKGEIQEIIGIFGNKELTGAEMHKCADLITKDYNAKGYITSYAYALADKLNQGILEIKVVEGITGSITVNGNRYFSTKLLKKKIELKEGEPFNYATLKTNVNKINRHIDREVKLELDPVKDRHITNIILSVKDKLPLHVTFELDNYGSHYIFYKRYKTIFTHNNVLGHDDVASVKIQRAEAEAQQLYDLNYTIPYAKNWKFEFYIMPYKKEDYYGEREDNDTVKKARKSYFNFYQTLINDPHCELVSSYGFVYKDIFWYAYGKRTNWDMFRALTWGLDLNMDDKYGRTIISNDFEMGIPRMWGGNTAKDDSCSVKSAGSKYKKNHFYIARRHKLFAGIDFIGKSHWQLSSMTLTGVNNFSIGGFMGVIDNRGYPRAEAPSDSGTSLMGGFSFPPYFIPKHVKVPFSKAKFYNALKLFTFYEWAQGKLKSPKTGQEKTETLRSAGCGFTFDLPEALSIRVDLGWPLDMKQPKDGDHFHAWFRVTKSY